MLTSGFLSARIIFQIITARKRSLFAKVMFLHLSVILLTGGGGVRGFIRGGMHSFIPGGVRGFIRGVCMVLFRGHAWFYSGGVHGFIRGGMHGFIRGACVVLFGGGACMVLFGGRAWFYLGACVVLFGGRAWFYWGDMRGFIRPGFPSRGGGSANLLFWPYFSENCLKIDKKLDRQRGAFLVDPPMIFTLTQMNRKTRLPDTDNYINETHHFLRWTAARII